VKHQVPQGGTTYTHLNEGIETLEPSGGLQYLIQGLIW
jgi:hypothetical protein